MQAGGVAGFEQRVQEDVVGFEHGIGFQFAAPEAVGMLKGEKVFARDEDGFFYIRQVLIDAAESRRRGV